MSFKSLIVFLAGDLVWRDREARVDPLTDPLLVLSWALPLMAMQQWQSEHLTKFGAGKCDYVDYLTFQDKLGLLTANATTPYIMAFPNLKETGPLVFEVPAGPTAGGFTDFWQRPITDSGQTGPDKGMGGKYLILGPDDPDMKPEGYYVFRSPTVNVWSAHRVLDPDPVKAKALIDALRIYPYSQGGNPGPTRHVAPAGRKWSGEQPRGLAYWEGLSKIIDEEPVHERDRMIMGMLQPLGIEKGKPFNPTERQQEILIDATRTGEVMARTIGYKKRFEGAKVWIDRHWDISLFLKETRCFVDTGVTPDRSSRDEIVKNADGSIDLYFGPTAPAGKPESNWIKTLPGKGWFTYFRLYGPTAAYFDRSWKLADIERVE